jgi:hypothetical protein
VLGSVVVSSNGTLRFELTGLLPGIYTCIVNYTGDTNHIPATSAGFTLNVTQ